MAAQKALRQNKAELLDILRSDPGCILKIVDAEGLITKRQYDNLKEIHKEDKEGHVVKLLDTIIDRGEENCEAFLQILQTDSAIEDFPRLKKIRWDDKSSSRKRAVNHPCPASVDGPGSSKIRKEDVTDASYSDDDRYKFTSKTLGLCVIINNKDFGKDEEPRDGTDADADKLARIFTWLGFTVVMCEDQTKKQMLNILGSFSSLKSLTELQESKVKKWTGQEFTDLNVLPHHEDAFVCCILTHGKSEGVCGTDGKIIPTRDIISPFNSSNCPALHTKPKLFFIQACRGGGVQEGVPVNTDGDWENLNTRLSYSLPEYADFLIGFSTIDLYSAAREKDGTWYMQILCKQLEYGCTREYDILRILTRVTDEVCQLEGKLKGGGDFKQSPDSMNTLRRLLVLRPI